MEPLTGERVEEAGRVADEEPAPPGAPCHAAAAYDRAMRRRFAAKDAVSWLVQSFLARPPAFEYAARRLVERPDVRATMGLVMGDLVPASRALDPRFLAALLAP